MDMQAGVRNNLTGTIVDIKQGDIMSEVITRVGDNEITSVMTTNSLREVGFKVGDTSTALIKAVNVVLVK
jgi:molybdate transport system regulatory protein